MTAITVSLPDDEENVPQETPVILFVDSERERNAAYRGAVAEGAA
jgi:hypothetical protein